MRMTENFPGGPGDGSRRPDESAETGLGRPEDQRPQAADPSTPSVPPEPGPSAEPPAPQAGPGQTPNPWSQAGASTPAAPPPPTYPAYPAYGAPQDPPSGGQPTYPPHEPQQATQPVGGYAYQGGPATGPLPSGPPTATYPVAGMPEPRRKGAGGLVAGIAVLALVVGGAAGGLGGYLVAGRGGSTTNMSALDQPAPASQASNAPAGSTQAVAQRLLPVVVEIAAEFQSQGQTSGDTGSGFIISSDGNILTNNHVVAGAAAGGRLQVIFANGKTVDASIIGRDPTTDIAVIKAQGVSGLPLANLGRSDDLQVGQSVVAIGAPFELSGTVTSGIVSSLHRPTAAGDSGQSSQQTVLDAIQTDAPINPGNSGGPLVDMQGRVIGINSAIYSPNGGQQSQGGSVGIGFAIPIDQAKRTADQIVKTGKATQTILGVQVTDNTPTTGGQSGILPNGALITGVTPGGPADKGGLKSGAVVVKVNDRAVSSADGLVAAVHAAAPNDQMKLGLADGSSVTVTLAGQTVNVN
jgi:putative serine protease PepD